MTEALVQKTKTQQRNLVYELRSLPLNTLYNSYFVV